LPKLPTTVFGTRRKPSPVDPERSPPRRRRRFPRRAPPLPAKTGAPLPSRTSAAGPVSCRRHRFPATTGAAFPFSLPAPPLRGDDRREEPPPLYRRRPFRRPEALPRSRVSSLVPQRPPADLLISEERRGEKRASNSMEGGDMTLSEFGGGGAVVDTKVLHAFQTSFVEVQNLLDQNRILINEINQNHESKVPADLSRNVRLIRELNNNIRRVVDLYADLSSLFAASDGGDHPASEGGSVGTLGAAGAGHKRIRIF
ncbi:hypothetical protein U9M48_026982, partial [Paspalum notatum var. saurae]